MAKILALDVGEKRIGLALSDELEIIASPYKTIDFDNAASELTKIITEERVGRMVIGLPYLADGLLGSQAKPIQKFVEKLKKKISIPLEYENEILTSKEAEGRLREYQKEIREKGEIDTMAATIILESYLRRKKN